MSSIHSSFRKMFLSSARKKSYLAQLLKLIIYGIVCKYPFMDSLWHVYFMRAYEINKEIAQPYGTNMSVF